MWDDNSIRRDFTALEQAGPCERARMMKRKPLPNYFWPRRPLSSSASSELTSSPQASVTVSTSEVTIPVISVTRSSAGPEPEATAQALQPPQINFPVNSGFPRSPILEPVFTTWLPPGLTQTNTDESKLTVQMPQRSKDSRSRLTVKPRERRDSNLAPKPSIFSFDLCKHPRCPLVYAHEKDIFRHKIVMKRPPEVPEGGFGDFGPCYPPPFEVSNALYRVERCRKRQAQGKSCVVNQEDIDVVEGFQEAHCRETNTGAD